jgi:hypothetical protein
MVNLIEKIKFINIKYAIIYINKRRILKVL